MKLLLENKEILQRFPDQFCNDFSAQALADVVLEGSGGVGPERPNVGGRRT